LFLFLQFLCFSRCFSFPFDVQIVSQRCIPPY
jgi:hypothetical protein